ncbi:MAG: hypothetical protein COU71_02810 [Parcubacteria group bacterium CG10_big_fil_rev_8_21_14_0_10_38_31]|nr:MAG: hypothetical protein COU71_02810 [Parcubacteria group bacterium CG10_big_fil_rev_8_21_14_0_10_38_31]
MENNEYLHEVAITAIIIKDEKYLITRRSPSKKKFPGMWTVPGGRMEKSDYLKIPKDTNHHWYNVLEKTLRREVKEETALDIDNIWYVTSLAMIGKDGVPSLIISCAADYTGGEVKLQEEECDEFAWVSLEESKNYDLIEGIYEELAMTEKKIKGEKIDEWKKT